MQACNPNFSQKGVTSETYLHLSSNEPTPMGALTSTATELQSSKWIFARCIKHIGNRHGAAATSGTWLGLQHSLPRPAAAVTQGGSDSQSDGSWSAGWVSQISKHFEQPSSVANSVGNCLLCVRAEPICYVLH